MGVKMTKEEQLLQEIANNVQEYTGRTGQKQPITITKKRMDFIKQLINKHTNGIQLPLTAVNQLFNTNWRTTNNGAYQLKTRTITITDGDNKKEYDNIKEIGIYVGVAGKQNLYFRLL